MHGLVVLTGDDLDHQTDQALSDPGVKQLTFAIAFDVVSVDAAAPLPLGD
jgi:hypothetical protein